MTRMRREAYVRHSQKRTHRDGIHLQAITLLLTDGRDQALQCRFDHPGPVKTEGNRPDRAGHVKESPSGGGEFLFDLATVRIISDPRPATLGQVAFEPQRLRKKSALFD